MAETPRFFDQVADISKKADVVVGSLALLAGSVGIVALSVLSYYLTDRIQKGGK